MAMTSIRIDNRLKERLHFVGSSKASEKPWVHYSLLGIDLADFPDDGQCVVQQVVSRIREEFGLGLPEAYQVWKNRELIV